MLAGWLRALIDPAFFSCRSAHLAHALAFFSFSFVQQLEQSDRHLTQDPFAEPILPTQDIEPVIKGAQPGARSGTGRGHYAIACG